MSACKLLFNVFDRVKLSPKGKRIYDCNRRVPKNKIGLVTNLGGTGGRIRVLWSTGIATWIYPSGLMHYRGRGEFGTPAWCHNPLLNQNPYECFITRVVL